MEESKICYICLEKVENPLKLCNCGSPCHNECLNKYLEFRHLKTCTICKSKLNLELIKYNYTNSKFLNFLILNTVKLLKIPIEFFTIFISLILISFYVIYSILLPVLVRLFFISGIYYSIYKMNDYCVSLLFHDDYWGKLFFNNFLVISQLNIILYKISLYRN